jgi:hypothetical protein
MQILGIYLYMTAVGFVAAGVLASFVQLVSGEPMRFVPGRQSILVSIGGVLLLVFAGPAVLMRNACRGLQERPKVWFGISTAIAAVWSLGFGVLLVMLMLKLAASRGWRRMA